MTLLNDPRTARHMPLSATFTETSAAAWVRAKDDQWVNNGYGPWAVLVDGDFAGWGGFQREERGADFALVLSPAHWGRGAEVARAALQLGFGELGLDEVVIALPQSRKPSRVVARYGFVPDDDVTYDGIVFRQYRLTRQSWSAVDQLRRS
jgi:RimJ/RimL family protein N-acetyltransferase